MGGAAQKRSQNPVSAQMSRGNPSAKSIPSSVMRFFPPNSDFALNFRNRESCFREQNRVNRSPVGKCHEEGSLLAKKDQSRPPGGGIEAAAIPVSDPTAAAFYRSQEDLGNHPALPQHTQPLCTNDRTGEIPSHSEDTGQCFPVALEASRRSPGHQARQK